MNQSKIQPREFKILVFPEVVEERSAGGIILAQTTKEKEQMAQVKGKLVAAGGNAFEDWADPPEIGSTVYIGKYAGYTVKGADGQEYRLCNDKDIAATIEP